MNAVTLHDAIDDVCPIISCMVGDQDDRATWSFVPTEAATQAQIDAGNNVIATIPINPIMPCATADFVGRFTNQEYVKLAQQRLADTQAAKAGFSKNWDMVVATDLVDFNRKKVQTLRDQLVAAGVITQARADQIFG